MKHDHTAFIFSRGGSKGVKDKNIREVAGKPLITHSIHAALESKYISRVIVSTDSEKIAKVARESGAEVLDRPEELASDTSSEILSWKHAIENNQDSLHSTFISLPATSPLRNTADIDSAMEKYYATECDVLFGISPAHRNPWLNMVKIDEKDHIEILISGSSAVRRQDVPEVFDVTTCVYIGNTDYINKCNSLMEGDVGYSLIPTERSLDIDTEYDLYLADLLLRNPYNKNSEKK